MGFALSLSVLLVLFALLVVGLPPSLTSRITAQAREAGIPLQVESIRLSIHHGWVLHNVRLYSTSPDDLQPLLSAEKLYVIPWPVDWKRPSEGGWHIRFYVKDLGVSLGRPWENVLPENHPFRTVSKLKASLIVAPGRIGVESAELNWGGVDIVIHGNAVLSGNNTIRQDTTDFRSRAAKAADVLSRLKCEKTPQLSLTFNFNDGRPEETFLDTVFTSEGITLRDRVYKQLAGAGSYRDQTWTLYTLQLIRSSQEQLVLRGTINLESSNAQVSVQNTLSAADLFNLLPEDEQSAVAQTGVKPYGRLDFTASLGPAPYDLLTEKAEIQVQQAQLKYEDITLDPLTFHLSREGSRVQLTNLQARVNGGPVVGGFNLDLESKAWTARVKTQCDPVIAASASRTSK